MVHSAIMRGEHFDLADDFDEQFTYPAVTWSCGGSETYHLAGKRTVSIQPAGVLTIAAEERYAYAATAEGPFRSNMIAFPHWVREEAGRQGDIQELSIDMPQLTTRFCRPGSTTFSIMMQIASHCARGFRDLTWYTEQMVLLYARLLIEQNQNQSGSIDAIKQTTRRELARRVERSSQFILEEYRKADISIEDIAGAACLSRFHLIRTFKENTGQTPMQYLAATRMEAALRLLANANLTIGSIARAVGYCDRTAFVRAFNRHYGAPPSVLRGQ